MMSCTRVAAPWPSLLVFAVTLVPVGCGGGAATPSSTNEPTSGAEASATPVVDQGRVLVLGRALMAGQIEIAADGTIGGADGFGRMDEGGTLYRADGTVCARIARDGTFHIEEPSRLRETLSLRIDADVLIVASGDDDPEVFAAVVDGRFMLDGRHLSIEGLTPEYHHTVLAAFAMMLIAMEEAGPMHMF